ncbi:hypothetical protein ACFT8V_27250 [Streptomyces griseoincarnatus]
MCPEPKDSDKDTGDQANKDLPPKVRPLSRVVRALQKWHERQGRIVYRQMLRGASYSLGSCAVSVAIIWVRTRH